MELGGEARTQRTPIGRISMGILALFMVGGVVVTYLATKSTAPVRVVAYHRAIPSPV